MKEFIRFVKKENNWFVVIWEAILLLIVDYFTVAFILILLTQIEGAKNWLDLRILLSVILPALLSNILILSTLLFINQRIKFPIKTFIRGFELTQIIRYLLIPFVIVMHFAIDLSIIVMPYMLLSLAKSALFDSSAYKSDIEIELWIVYQITQLLAFVLVGRIYMRHRNNEMEIKVFNKSLKRIAIVVSIAAFSILLTHMSYYVIRDTNETVIINNWEGVGVDDRDIWTIEPLYTPRVECGGICPYYRGFPFGSISSMPGEPVDGTKTIYNFLFYSGSITIVYLLSKKIKKYAELQRAKTSS
ncbi:hypothetical protein GF389_06205 [Candidatus Dojkabacteria bacterium]|nr:hypothetical protein [Candidatus Dojkabacteria bacterium]